MPHNKIEMKKNALYKVMEDKYILAHRARCGCSCSDIVLNLLGGKRFWTRVQFDCGERIKINCHCLKRLNA